METTQNDETIFVMAVKVCQKKGQIFQRTVHYLFVDGYHEKMKYGHKLFSDKIWRTKVLSGWIPRRLESKCSST